MVLCQVKKIPFVTFFYDKITDIYRNMKKKPEKSVFWTNLDNLITKLGIERKKIIASCKLSDNSISQGITRKSSPSVDTAYCCAKALNTSVEYLVDGDKGAEYIRSLAINEGNIYHPPEKIADIVNGLNKLSDEELKMVRAMVNGAVAEKEGKRETTG